ncbi:MAG: hypothetical protein PUG43_05405, partial [Clostridiales bacterium]|nr:hypothetical protein [Clostridiales bacterium]
KHRKVVVFTRSRNIEELDTELLIYKNYRDVIIWTQELRKICKEKKATSARNLVIKLSQNAILL